VRLRILDLAGRTVRTLADGSLAAGTHTVHWDGRDGDGRAVPPGVYRQSLETAGERVTRLLVRLR
jgi:flagellar basal-body rod modification protein FlgD